jgi:hypothetical protein
MPRYAISPHKHLDIEASKLPFSIPLYTTGRENGKSVKKKHKKRLTKFLLAFDDDSVDVL